MGVIDGQAVSAGITNPAFLDATEDDTATGKLTLANTDPASGSTINNIQQELNAGNSYTGKAANAAYNVKPAWVNNDVGSSLDTLKDRSDALTYQFNSASGHAHSGAPGDGPQIPGSNIASVPLRGYVQQGVDIIGVTGSSSNISSQFSSKVSGGGTGAVGVVTSAPWNKVVIRQASGANQDDVYKDSLGNVVYGRVTYAASVWTLSYFVNVSGTETAFSFASASDVRFYYQEIFSPLVSAPTYSEFAVIPSDNATIDVITATASQQGKVQLATSVQAIASTGAVGTQNGTVANADHTHEGAHSVGIDGDPTTLLGDVKLKAGTGIGLSYVSGKLQIDLAAAAVGYSETLGGTSNGVNTIFGPLTYTPADANSILVFVDSIFVPPTEWTYSSGNIVFSGGNQPVSGQPVLVWYIKNGTQIVPPTPSGIQQVEYRTVTAGEESAKAMTLAALPSSPAKVMLDLIGGTAQIYNTDFVVTGSTLSWSGLGLDGLIASGDVVRVMYWS